MRANSPTACGSSSRQRWPADPIARRGERPPVPRTMVQIDPELNGILRAPAFAADPVVVRDRDTRLDEPLRAAAAAMRIAATAEDVTSAVRTLYKRIGIDPTKMRPSSEALLRRVRKGDELPRINSLVDVINWCSLESQLPFGLYDLDKILGSVELRLGRPGEEYAGIRKDV